MSDMKSLFNAGPKSVFALLAEPGLGFYIPAYQRPYSWSKDNTLRLVEDVVRGVAMMRSSNGDAITFLGTMILIHDVKYQTVEPQVKGELPMRVMLVIDGQQRITTLLLLNAVLHNEIGMRIALLTKKGAELDFGLEWIRQRALQTRANLAMTIFQDMNYGEGDFRYYPRTIRAYDDSWSRSEKEARYHSPVARLLHEYGMHARTMEGKQFQPTASGTSGGYKALADNWKAVRGQLRALAGGTLEEMPELHDLGVAAEEAMFQQQLPPEVIALVKGGVPGSDDKSRTIARELLRLVLLSRYLLERAAVTEVVAKDDDYAFDIFEALNTSGEPLTAYDTFKPRVIKAEGQSRYEGSASFSTMAVVERYLDRYKDSTDKHDATSRLLIPFALAETGTKLSKHLSEQRRYLKDQYEKFASLSDKRAFVQHLAQAAELLEQAWPDESSRAPKLSGLDLLDAGEQRVTLFCLDVLRASKHAVTLGPLIRFFAATSDASLAERTVSVRNLAAAVRAMTAFLALWRGPRTTTSNIDQQYRTLMSRGVQSVGILGFSRRPATGQRGVETATASRFCEAMRSVLHDPELGDTRTKAEWVRRTAEQPLGEAPAVAKLLLFAATHNSHVDPAGGGLIVPARQGTLDLLDVSHWRELAVEHIAPQTRSVAWDGTLYESDHVQRLGNLTLLPTRENSSVGNRPWIEKRLIYSILSAPTAPALNEHLAEAGRHGISVAASTEELLSAARFHPQLASLGLLSTEWTTDIIEQRSRRLAELAWDRLAPWLGITGEAV